jgi:mycothiol synthase
MNLELRAPTLDDLQALTDLINRDADELYGKPEESVDSMRMWLTGPTLNPQTDIRVAEAGSDFCGYVDLDADPHPVYWVDLRVPPSEDDGVRVALMDWAEARARERGGELLRFHAASIDAPIKALLESRGYRVIRHFYRMRIEFDGDPPEAPWPEGVGVRAGTRDDGRLAYDLNEETFEDHWEHSRLPFEEWEHRMMREGFDPALWFFAEDGGEIAGIALCREHEGERGLGWVSVLGVRKQWRRRGLGRALLLHCFHEFQGRGFHAAALGVDAASLTGANRLYESAGMYVARQSDVYEKTL